MVYSPEAKSLAEAIGLSGCAGGKLRWQEALCIECKGLGDEAGELYARVRCAVRVEGISRREAARRFGIDPRTVAKMLSFSVPQGYRRSRPPARPKLDPFVGVIEGILEEDEGRPAKPRHTSKRIFERLRAAGPSRRSGSSVPPSRSPPALRRRHPARARDHAAVARTPHAAADVVTARSSSQSSELYWPMLSELVMTRRHPR